MNDFLQYNDISTSFRLVLGRYMEENFDIDPYFSVTISDHLSSLFDSEEFKNIEKSVSLFKELPHFTNLKPKDFIDSKLWLEKLLECKIEIDDGDWYGLLGSLLNRSNSTIVLSDESKENLSWALLLNKSKGSAFRLNKDMFTSLFDVNYYQNQAGYQKDLLNHYRTIGWKSGLNPHPLFITNYYLQQRPIDIKSDPITDFLIEGWLLPISTHPLLKYDDYVKFHPGIIGHNHPLLHYLRQGWRTNGRITSFFDQEHYQEQCPGLIDVGFPPLIHYALFGSEEDRRPVKNFTPKLFARMAGIADDQEPLAAFIEGLSFEPAISGDKPSLSFVILNLNKSILTLQCLYFLKRRCENFNIEIIVVDNGSNVDDFGALSKYGNVKVIRLNRNVGFGEANNIGVEAASHENIVFLNNDVFVEEGWIEPLYATLEDPRWNAGAVGPMFLYPNGQLQEAGALVFSDGSVVQIGKRLDSRNPLFNNKRPVDYISAATLLMKKSVFLKVGGFDLCWDPAYYEDVDLCLKVKLLGHDVVYVPESKVIHLENATSGDGTLNLNLHNIVEVNRKKFIDRWAGYLENPKLGMPDLEMLDVIPSPATDKTRSVALYTGYPLTSGGGERYLLQMAFHFSQDYTCTVITNEKNSGIRLRNLAQRLKIDLSRVRLCEIRDAIAHAPYDIFIAMGNEVLPPTSGLGARNVHLCQFPFPISPFQLARDWENDSDFEHTIVYSDFVKQHYDKARAHAGLPKRPPTIVHPPAMQRNSSKDKDFSVLKVLNVGRFDNAGHDKKQDVMIKAFGKVSRSPSTIVSLDLAGSINVTSSSRDYFLKLKDQAKTFNVEFYPDCSSERIDYLYDKCNVYWHLTGMLNNVEINPHKFEHFGISIVEAMSAGLIPVVIGHAGPAEIVEHGVSGFHVFSEADLIEVSLRLSKMDNAELSAMSRSAVARAQVFSDEVFYKELDKLAASILPEGPRSVRG